MFSVHSQAPDNTGHFVFLSEENSVTEFTYIIATLSSKNSVFYVHIKTQSRRFQSIRFDERFRKVPFMLRTRVDGRANRRKKAPFPNFSVVV